VQWHPEAGEEIIGPWADNDRDDAVERGVDVDAYLGHVAAARPRLLETWRVLAEQFVSVCREPRLVGAHRK
jgi:GMP synthase (glutamine-hydrolysing)